MSGDFWGEQVIGRWIERWIQLGWSDVEIWQELNRGAHGPWRGDERRRVQAFIRSARKAGGAPPGDGLTVEKLEELVLANWRANAPQPTQAALRIATGYSERRISQVAHEVGGYRKMLRRLSANRHRR